jgi:hypothetical protein
VLDSCIEHLDYRKVEFTAPEFKNYMRQFEFYLNPETISEDHLKHLHILLLKYFKQMLKTLAFEMKLDEPLPQFKVFESEFKSILSTGAEPEKTDSDIDYPQHIFGHPIAYLLFHDFAKRHFQRVVISYLYRRMHEKEHLLL